MPCAVFILTVFHVFILYIPGKFFVKMGKNRKSPCYKYFDEIQSGVFKCKCPANADTKSRLAKQLKKQGKNVPKVANVAPASQPVQQVRDVQRSSAKRPNAAASNNIPCPKRLNASKGGSGDTGILRWAKPLDRQQKNTSRPRPSRVSLKPTEIYITSDSDLSDYENFEEDPSYTPDDDRPPPEDMELPEPLPPPQSPPPLPADDGDDAEDSDSEDGDDPEKCNVLVDCRNTIARGSG